MLNRRIFFKRSGGLLLTPLVTNSLIAELQEMDTPFKLPISKALADPFCIKTPEGWYLTGTNTVRYKSKTDLVFELFHSTDLRNWKSLGPLLKIPDYEGSLNANYWAPEILPHQGKYYFYYTSDSFGDPERRFVRVGVADKITGPYLDSGRALNSQPAIDGDPFFVSGNEGYLFYTGNEGNDHVGQLLVDKFVSPLELENKPRRVFPEETVEWEEGPFVIRRDGTFYLFSSQGNWRDETYHVLVSKAASLPGPFVRCANKDGERRVLSTAGGQRGPGHNSIFKGPEAKDYICYHAWDKARTGRWAWIAPIEWEDGFPYVRQ